jgi:hypothetical protein
VNAARASDFDRDTAVDILCAAVADGRLTLDELEGRVEAALSARTLRDLALLIADLILVSPLPVNPFPVNPLPARPVSERPVSGGPLSELSLCERPSDERDGPADRWALLRSVLAAAE